MNKTIDKKTRDTLLNALEKMTAHSRQLQDKREQQLWKSFETPCNLSDVLSYLTKSELDSIRQNLDLRGISALKKGELAEVLEQSIPHKLKDILYKFDLERYDLLHKIIKKTKVSIKDSEFSISKIRSLREIGIIFPGIDQDQKFLTMPSELMDIFAQVDGTRLKEVIRRNTEWIGLTHGMLYYYGVMSTSDLVDRLRILTNQEVDSREYLNVFAASSHYYKQARFSPSGIGLEDYRVINGKKLMEEHKKRPTIDYYPFTKKQLLKAGDPSYFERTPQMGRLLLFLSQYYDIDQSELNELALQLISLINKEANLSGMMDYLQNQFEFQSFEFVQQVTQMVVDVHNTTFMWALKGYSPSWVSINKERNQLKPIPSMIPMRKSFPSNVIEISSRTKTGRNDPCTCGSGKKRKKCCGNLE
ncbi:YecA family protein [Bacillus sp. DJP31]|uniref:YecA/YgfB family protein n=1 Tax=Bacillus sp. DJP31 TaxID=3409789 RepID=UPI003BB80A55